MEGMERLMIRGSLLVMSCVAAGWLHKTTRVHIHELCIISLNLTWFCRYGTLHGEVQRCLDNFFKLHFLCSTYRGSDWRHKTHTKNTTRSMSTETIVLPACRQD